MKRGGGTGGKRMQAKALRGLWESTRTLVPNLCGTRDQFMEDVSFPWTWGWGRGGLDDSRALHSLCTLFLSLLHQLHLRSPGIRS